MIEKLFTEQTVAVDVAAKDWEEAVRYGGAIQRQNTQTPW